MKNNCVKVIKGFNTFLQNNSKSERTATLYRYHVERFAQWLIDNGGDPANPTRFDVQSYINHLEALGNNAPTINNKFAAISTYARHLERPGIVENIRLPEVRKNRNIAPKSMERNERNNLLRNVERDGNLRNIAIVYTLLLTGIRVSELVALNRDDVIISKRSGKITVRNGKGNVARSVPLASEARYHLGQYLNTREDNNLALFLSNFKQRITVRTVQHMLKGYGVHPHELRHTFCRELVSKGIDIATVAELAAHADVNVTRRYAMPTEKDLAEAIDKAFN